jgi:hypothetical protein
MGTFIHDICLLSLLIMSCGLSRCCTPRAEHSFAHVRVRPLACHLVSSDALSLCPASRRLQLVLPPSVRCWPSVCDVYAHGQQEVLNCSRAPAFGQLAGRRYVMRTRASCSGRGGGGRGRGAHTRSRTVDLLLFYIWEYRSVHVGDLCACQLILVSFCETELLRLRSPSISFI